MSSLLNCSSILHPSTKEVYIHHQLNANMYSTIRPQRMRQSGKHTIPAYNTAQTQTIPAYLFPAAATIDNIAQPKYTRGQKSRGANWSSFAVSYELPAVGEKQLPLSFCRV